VKRGGTGSQKEWNVRTISRREVPVRRLGRIRSNQGREGRGKGKPLKKERRHQDMVNGMIGLGKEGSSQARKGKRLRALWGKVSRVSREKAGFANW